MNALEQYTSDLFAPEDAVLRELRAEMPRRNIPEINVNALEGRLLQFLLRMVKARKALEIGSLAGYSGIWIARALPAGGKLITLELNPHHAATAREFYAKAGVADKVELREGAALTTLAQLDPEAPFDFCFIDADKNNNPEYLRHALRLVRPGGIIAVDNAYRHGAILDPNDNSPEVQGVRECNQMMATDPRLFSTIITTTDGLAVGLVNPQLPQNRSPSRGAKPPKRRPQNPSPFGGGWEGEYTNKEGQANDKHEGKGSRRPRRPGGAG
jgi:predicted O-methyltransferase YrrM